MEYENEVEVLHAIRDVLDGVEWNYNSAARIAKILDDAGYPVADIDGTYPDDEDECEFNEDWAFG